MRVFLLMPCGHSLGLTSWLSFVMSNCKVVTFALVSLVSRGASLYRFLIFALFLTLRMIRKYDNHPLHTHLWNREKEPQNTNSHKTSGRQFKQKRKPALSLPRQDDCKTRKDTMYERWHRSGINTINYHT